MMTGDRALSLAYFLLGSLLAGLAIAPAAAQPASPDAEIRAALVAWMNDFNAGRADKACELFAPSLRADNRGVGERDFEAQCQLLHGVLGDATRAFSYALDLKEIVAEGDMAAVRLVWTLTTRVKASGAVSTVEEQGLDVFGRSSDGHWRIIRFMTYQRP
jgi:ketosteroid isomerase-like protein